MRGNKVSSLRKKIVAFLVAPLSIIPLALVLGIFSCYLINDGCMRLLVFDEK
ncbi:hypothetical protein H1Q59_00630 [Holosporaceae bacterium 'Namur']|nr:hypothetical protein [Holosporaceae bacterium 'Namur']